ncbi:O-antigen polysaccharide polymerase Wzy [Streptococcus bovimastitidis]|uniref:O-antigen polysaccharide polymerase Wzy n=1 Tax=Streptococcus bovimastitidis TaxID=1856638 RepID=UPI0008FF1256|nr:O-antigen polysaccharide polymerase Wzy [Streptococcus bovimastitidis]
MNTDNLSYKRSISLGEFLFLIIYSSFIFILSYWAFEIFSTSIPSNYEHVIFPWIIVSFILTLIGFVVIYRTPLSDVAIWFVLVSYLFMFGHVFLKVFDLHTSLVWNPGTFFHPNDKLRGALYAILSLDFISLGYFLNNSFSKEKNTSHGSDIELTKNNINNNMYKVGWIIFIIGLFCSLLNSYIVVTSTFRAGTYTAYAEAAGATGFLDDFAYLIIPGSTFILCSRKYKLNSARIFTSIISFLYLVIMVFSGSRKTQLFSILTILICYRWVYGKHKLKLSTIISTSILGFLFLNLIYIIREYRTNLSMVIPSFIKSVIHLDFLREIFGETFAETGLSLYSVVSIVKYVPAVFHFEKGLTFVRSILAILPLGGFFPTFFKNGFSTALINKYTGIPVGSSLIGDFYWNFGMIGAIIFCLLFGIVLSKVGNMKYKGNYQEPLYFSFLFVIFICIRAGLMDIARPLAIMTLIPLLIKNLLIRYSKNRSI